MTVLAPKRGHEITEDKKGTKTLNAKFDKVHKTLNLILVQAVL